MNRLARTAKSLASLLPAPFDSRAVEALRWLARPEVRRSRLRTRQILARVGGPTNILGGPFKGLRFHGPSISAQGGYLPKLFGCYELECYPAIARIIQRSPANVVNIGAAEGYYAIGLLARIPHAEGICFEMETPFHGAIRTLALQNGVAGRLTIRGECTRRGLSHALEHQGRTLVVCDCEGAEDDLLVPDAIPRLRQVAILVELHEQLRPGVMARLRARFAPSHTFTVFESRGRERSDAPVSSALSQEDFIFAMDEGRASTMHWFLLEPVDW